jgi:hypothetical protein
MADQVDGPHAGGHADAQLEHHGGDDVEHGEGEQGAQA